MCSKGIWDTSIPGITFDGDGVSNYCRFQELMMDTYPRGDKGRADWEALVARMKVKGRGRSYDCIVGVSGGVDSSYLLVLMKKYGLRPLAVNLDNGFNSKIAVQNLYKVTKALDIDLETYVIDYEEVTDLLYAYMRAGIPWIDSPTDGAIKAVMYKIALKENVKFIVRGNDFRSEGKQPKEWTSGADVIHIHKKFGRGVCLKTYPKLSIPKIIYAGVFRRIRDIRPYYYLSYKKQDARKMLQEQFGWQDYGGHHHENLFTKFVMSYWLPRKFGIDKRRINLSAQVLSGAMTRDSALTQVEKPFGVEEEIAALKNYVLKKLDINEDEFKEIWDAPNKKAADFPANDRYIYGAIKYAKPLIDQIYAFVPMSVMAHDFFKKEQN
ncbi:MAG: N-acetyl sugar amidotransferase [Desulfobacterales bacterium]|nr:N-acetyl sugar amidotransferase [Desulfobacterales bacterium]